MFVDQATLGFALRRLYGTAGHLLKIWFTLKHMGLSENGQPVEVDTANSTGSLRRLYSCGAPDNCFYIPFAHTPRYLTMKHDASRSIIQTTIQRWASSGSVVTCDPTGFLDFKRNEGNKLKVAPGRRYPLGLGVGESGFAVTDGARVCIPIRSFAVWYGRQTNVPTGTPPEKFLVEAMLRDLNISPAEKELVFVDDNLPVAVQAAALTDAQIYSLCQPFVQGQREPETGIYLEEYSYYARRVRSMVSDLGAPSWMRISPEDETRDLLASGAKAILLYGPPRTGKTRFIDRIFPRDTKERETIQIHDGWGYDHLVEGFKPDDSGRWRWTDGPLKESLKDGKKVIVLEEINRTAFSQALGEVFSLIEEGYRGEKNAIILRSGDKFWIPDDVLFLLSMNTIDKSTEDIDDALLGRVAAVLFLPRPEDLHAMLDANGVPAEPREKLAQLFAAILDIYPLGHGYFAGLRGSIGNREIISYYKARIRPVLYNFLGELKQQEITKIDNIVDEMFGRA